MKILIIANARYKGGLSGSDNIYLNFKKYWEYENVKGCIYVQEMLNIDYKPFTLCYIHRIILGCWLALVDFRKYDFVYSASDFMPDTFPAIIYKIKGRKWIAGFYLLAFRDNRIYYLSQKLVKWFIDKFADMVIVTNPSMYKLFNKKKTWINGGVDLTLSGIREMPKPFDAVFVGRIHKSKGIDELIEIWSRVVKIKPNATLAIIGDGDLGIEYIRSRIWCDTFNIHLMGHMDSDRYLVYHSSKMVLYPTPKEYDHFSMSPVEAMSCGCPMVCFDNETNKLMCGASSYMVKDIHGFVNKIISLLDLYDHDKVEYNSIQNFAHLWATNFDYKKQALRVFNEIKKELAL